MTTETKGWKGWKQRYREVTLVEIVRVIGGSSPCPSGLEFRIMGDSLDLYLAEMGPEGAQQLNDIAGNVSKAVMNYANKRILNWKGR